MEKGVIFFAGTYGVGKTTLCDNISSSLSIPVFSASDLISSFVGETYGVNKIVKDKNLNQESLIKAVDEKLNITNNILLTGHFCIFNENNEVDELPSFVFERLHIKKIVLLEAEINTIIENLYKRDKRNYNFDSISRLKDAERQLAIATADKLKCPIYIYKMSFNSEDINNVIYFIEE